MSLRGDGRSPLIASRFGVAMLNDVRVLDLTRAFPYAGWLLTQMGATVIKVEEPLSGAIARSEWPRHEGVSTLFQIYNQGKKSIGLNLKAPEGKDAFLDLVATADVVVEGNRPGVMDRLGCGWLHCRERRPQLVYCAITGFGQTGPYSHRIGHDINYLSLAGFFSDLPEAGRSIAGSSGISIMTGSLTAAVGILGALMSARASGVGRFVDISLTDSIVSIEGSRLAEELFPRDALPQNWVDPDGDDFELGVYETSDGGFISLDPHENRFKDALWSIIEHEGCGRRPGRSTGRELVHNTLAQAIRSRPRARWIELLGESDACFAPVYGMEELVADPHLRFRGIFGDSLSPTAARPGLASPIRLDPPAITTPTATAPILGEHTTELLIQAGWTPERIAAAVLTGALVATVSGTS